MKVGIAADHGGFILKEQMMPVLKEAGHEVIDFGAFALAPADDFPDYVIPLAWAVAHHDVARGVAVCGSGVGACVAANKVAGVRACLVHDTFSARQGVEDDDMNILCVGGRVIGPSLAAEVIRVFLAAGFSGGDRFRRRLAKISALEIP